MNTLKMLETVIKEKSSLITPFAFVQVFNFLIMSTSQLGPSFSDTYFPDHIFLSVCSITSSMILKLGRYFRGRHNFIIRLLENLLFALCRPRRAAVHKTALTCWKRASWMPQYESCTIDCALAYTRLLANLCDSNRSRANLSKKRNRDGNSQGKDSALSSSSGSSRRALAKHVPFLITEYCYISLNYSFEADVLQALMPGIYTVFDIMGEHELAITNASVNATGRAIFKRLYEDYTKFGKWHEI